MKPKVSIVVPVYNVEKYLDRCMQSLFNQTLTEIEIILVDDESPDNCPALCDAYAKRDLRVKVVHKKNGGLGMACNSGIEVATGEYIAFCDSDDWVDPEMYKTMYDTAVKYDADAVYTGLKRVDGKGNVLSYLPHPDTFMYESDPANLMLGIIASSPNKNWDREIQVSAKVVLYKTSVIDVHNIRFVSERDYPSEDLIFNVSFLSVSKRVCILPLFFYNYFGNDQSITTIFKPNKFDKMLKLAMLLESYLTGIGIKPVLIQERIGRLVIGAARSFSEQIIHADISNEQKLMEFEKISKSKRLREISEIYPLRRMPLKHLVPHILIIYNKFKLLKFLYNVRKI